jgi:hypothetical protein
MFMISPRDFCLARRWKYRDGGYDWVIQSISHKVSTNQKNIYSKVGLS